MRFELYVHIPFCVRKCGYCDFLSAPADPETMEKYVDALVREIRAAGGGTVCTAYLGGGTPSLLTEKQIIRILDELHRQFSFTPDAEITMEANPGTLSWKKLCAMKEAGVTRLSIGLQSVWDWELSLLGRIHTFGDFRQSLSTARTCGFDNISADLMFALPGQTLPLWQETLRIAAGLGLEHISAYGLMIEEGTPFASRHLELPDEELWYAMYESAGEVLSGFGFQPYEISNYAREGRQCRHNIGYWTRVDYLGLGLGAASLWKGERFSNTRNLEKYLTWSACPDTIRENREILSVEDEMSETMFLGLRLRRGVEEEAFFRRFGKTTDDVFGEAVRTHTGFGTLERRNGFLRLTPKGIPVSNAVMSSFLLT